MDTLSHAVTGALLVRAASGEHRAGTPGVNSRMLAGALAAVFPDLDFGLRLAGTLTYLNWHQGPTHSLVLLPLWGLLLAWLCARATRSRYRWQMFYIPVCLGLAIHIAGDALTAYGPMLLSPFSDQRYFVPWLYLLDPVFTVIAVAGLAGVLLLRHGRCMAVIALAVLGAYIGWQGTLHHQALNTGTAHARAQALDAAEIHALPQPPGPFHWKVLVRHGDDYHEALINLRRQEPAPWHPQDGFLQRLDAAYAPVADAVWQHHARFGAGSLQSSLARQAWQQPALTPFRRFAMFPVLDHIAVDSGGTCVWFVDLRFTLPLIPPSYRFGLCRSGETGDWRLERLRGAFWID